MDISLGQSSLASALTASELQQLGKAGTLKAVKSGMVLLLEGQICDALYLLLQGTLNVFKTEKLENGVAIGAEQLGHLEPGEMAGEVGLLMQITSPVTYRAATDCQVFVLSRAAYEQWATTAPALSQKLALSIARAFDQKLAAIMTQVTGLLSDHESLVQTVERLKEKGGCPESIELQNQLQSQVQECQTKSKSLKRRTYSMAQERNKARSVVQNTQLLVGVMGGAVALLLLGNVWGWSKALSGSNGGAITHPTEIPYITSQPQCERRSGSVWANGRCLDFEHDPSF